MLRKSCCQIIPLRRFEIEGEAHIATQYDDVEPKSVQEALTCPNKNEYIKAMMKKLESMRKKKSSIGLG